MIYWDLFWNFFQIGLFSFGGGYAAVPLIQSHIVEENQWLTLGQFADLITIAEMTPGPVAINCATFVGQQVGGTPGAVICTLGCILPSLIIVLLLSLLYLRFRSLKAMQGILTGLRPAIVAMIASAGTSLLVLALFSVDMAQIQEGSFQSVEFVIFLVSFFLLRKYKTSPIAIILGSGLVGSVIYLVSG